MHAPDTPATDAELLRGFVAGDEGAFVAFVERHHPALERWLRHVVGRSPEVDDIVQETFFVVMNSAERFEGTGSARSWLFGIARHRVARQFRRRVNEPATYDSLEDLGLRAGWGDPEASAVQAEEFERLHEAFERLQPEAREILLLRDIEEFTTPEAAQILDITVAAAKSRLHRARLALLGELRATAEVSDG